MSALTVVPFYGDELQATQDGDRVLVALRPMCEALGLDFSAQLKRVKSAPWGTVAMIAMVAQDGATREVICLTLDAVPMWLATVHAGRSGPAVREKLERYQREAAKVLADAFLRPASTAIAVLDPKSMAIVEAVASRVTAPIVAALADVRNDIAETKTEQRRQGMEITTLKEAVERHLAHKRKTVKPTVRKRHVEFIAGDGIDLSATPAPQWSEPDLAGHHNSDLAASTLRILHGGSWKNQNMVVLMPSAKMVSMTACMSWMNLMYPPNQQAHRLATIGMEVGEAYSNAIEGILAHPLLSTMRFLLTIETDNIPPPDGVLKLLAHMEAHPEFACIQGLYWTKGEGGVPQIWGDARDPVPNFRPQPPDPAGGLVECWGTGMGFNLWRLDMFKDARLRKPWFKTVASVAEGVGTQDLYAWSDFRKHGYRCAVACDVLVGHMDVATEKIW